MNAFKAVTRAISERSGPPTIGEDTPAGDRRKIVEEKAVSRWIALVALAVAALSMAFAGCGGDDADEGGADTAALEDEDAGIPDVTVRFAHEPYFDHTQASIALQKGWFEDVGITIQPGGEGIVAEGDEAIAVFSSGRVDVISGSAQLFMPAVENLPPYKLFAIGDIFQGYGLMAKPEFKTYGDLLDEGVAEDEALEESIGQMKGNHFCFPSEAAIKGFIDLTLQRGGVTLDDLETTVAPDAQTTSLMQSGRCDFQVGGVPSRLTLELAGFKPVVSSGDLAATAEPTADSEELRAVFHDGWVTTDEWLEANRETALRLISVSLRINQFINEMPEEAAEIHTPFLNSVAGTDFDPELPVEVVYPSLDPFLTWDQQLEHCFSESNPLNVDYVVGAAIKLYEEQGVFEQGQHSADDFTVACDLLAELRTLKEEAEAAMEKAQAGRFLDEAKKQYDAFNYLDAARFAKAAAGE